MVLRISNLRIWLLWKATSNLYLGHRRKRDALLYRGRRTIEGKVTPTFKTSIYPIRKDVGTLSTQYNAGINAYEVVYVDFNGQLKHLLRDPSTKM